LHSKDKIAAQNRRRPPRPDLTPRHAAWGLLLGLVVGLLLSLARMLGFFGTWQLRSADFLHGDVLPGNEIVIVAIDDASAEQLGAWPWPHSTHARLIEALSEARVVAIDILFEEREGEGPVLAGATRQAGNIVYPIIAILSERTGAGLIQAQALLYPPPALQSHAAGLGAVNVLPDYDGVVRHVPLIIQKDNRLVEALSLQVLRHYLGLTQESAIELNDGHLAIGSLVIPVDRWGRMLINFVGEPGSFPAVSYADVLSGAVPPSAFRDKIVLVGQMELTGSSDQHVVPTSHYGQQMSGVEVQANIIHTILKHRFLRRQSLTSDVITIFALALLSGFILPRLRLLGGIFCSSLLGIGYVFLAFSAFNRGLVLDLLYPVLSLSLSYVVIVAGRFLLEERQKRRVTDLFARYVAPAIVDEILSRPEAVALEEAREQEVTVLFADIRGFTGFSEKRSPRQVVDVLNRHLDRMTEVAFAHGGTVDKFVGDGIMLLFNAPLPQADHAQRAIQAALAMQSAVAQLNEGQETLRYGIGIHTGPAVVGSIGSRRRLEYTAIGDTVNLTSRLEGAAEAGQILISRATYERVKEQVQVREIGPLQVKGRQEAVEVYEVIGWRVP